MLEELTSQDFSKHLNQTFCIQPGSHAPLEVELISVTELGPPPEAASQRQAFSLVFRGPPSDTYLPQQIYRVTHSKLGDLDVFLVPIGPDQWLLKADGQTLLNTTFANWVDFPQAYPEPYPNGDNPARTGAAEINTLGYLFGPNILDAVYNLAFTFAHSSETLLLDFEALGLQGLSDESWGLDNIIVEITSGSESAYMMYLPMLIR